MVPLQLRFRRRRTAPVVRSRRAASSIIRFIGAALTRPGVGSAATVVATVIAAPSRTIVSTGTAYAPTVCA
ncbi:hypothetical protein [Streptomyces sp. NPDC052042]|uniref:hypothetical protein n=1 Tax=Streptomyces sp. NPDC052042 TaxID=3365683 RepID=UPI0037D18EA3